MSKSYRQRVNLQQALFIRLRLLLCALALLLAAGQAQAVITWSDVGTLTEFTEFVQYPALAVSPTGVPHLAFIDGNNSNQVVVRQYSGGHWTSIGTGLPNSGTWTSLAFDSTGTAYVAFADNSSTFAHKLTVMKLVGSAWTLVGTQGLSTNSAAYIKIAFDHADTPYVAFQDGAAAHLLTVVKYSAGSWADLGGATGFSAGAVYDSSLAFDSSNNPYVAYSDITSSSKPVVAKFNGTIWSMLGGAPVSASAAAYPALAIDASDHLYLAYSDGGQGNKLTVAVSTDAGVSWAAVGGFLGFSSGTAQYTAIAFDSAGNPYVAFQDGASSQKLTVMKYDLGWSTVGTAGFGSGAVTHVGIAFDPADKRIPYVSAQDAGVAGNDLLLGVLPTVPSAPTGVSATAGDSQATVDFVASTLAGSSAITGYTVSSDPAGGIDQNAASLATSHLVTGLSNGVAYTFTVQAINAAGNSAASIASSSVTPAGPPTLPGAPTGVSAVPGNASAAVSFSAPANNGGSVITGYTVFSNPAGGVDDDAGIDSTTHNVTGLSNGTAYTFTVIASNVVGNSVASTASAAVTPQSAPGVPGNVVATITALGVVEVSFTAPTGGGVITGYTVHDGWGDVDEDAGSTALTHHFSTLVSDGSRSYSFWVTASGGGGDTDSGYSNTVTPTWPSALAPARWNDLDVDAGYSAGDKLTLQFMQPVSVASLTLAGMSVDNSHSLGSPTLTALSPSGGYASAFTLTVPASGWTAAGGDTLTIVANNVVGRGNNQAASDVTFILPTVDNQAPTLSGLTVSPATTTATASVSSDEAATYYWFVAPTMIVQECGECSFPNQTSIKNHNYNPSGNGAYSPLAFGSGSIAATAAVTISMAGLSASTAYTLWLLAEDGAAVTNYSIAHIAFSSAAAPVVVDTTPPPPAPPPVVVPPPVIIPPLPPSVSIIPVTDPSTIFTGSTGATVDPTSGVVVLSSTSTTPVTLSNTAPDNVGIKPATNVPVTFTNSQGNSVTITGLTGDTLLVTRKVGSTTLIEVASGTARIEPSSTTAIPLLSKTDNSTATLSPGPNAAATSVVVRRNDTGIAAFIESGSTVYKSVDSHGNSTPDATVYSGETANFSNQGNVDQVKLGSLDGDRNLPGDPIKNIPNVDPGLIVPQLGGNVARLGGDSILDSLKNQIDAALGSPPGAEVSFDPASGVVVYKLNGVEARFIPLGNLLISLTGFAENGFVATNAGQTASGTFKLVDRGVQLTLASTLGYFTDFDAAVKASDPTGKVTLKASGALWIDLLGSQYITQPGYLAQSSGVSGKPNVYFGSDGQLSFRDSKGGVQVLYPTLADAATLQNILASLAPGASVKPQGDGTAAANVLGSDYTLVPQYQLVAVPGKYIMSTWWLDNGTLYYTMPTIGKAQGFTVK